MMVVRPQASVQTQHAVARRLNGIGLCTTQAKAKEGCTPSEGNDIGKWSADVGQLAGLDESGGQCLLLLGCCLHLTHLLTSCRGQAAF